MLISVSEAMNQASFFMPSIFFAILLYSVPDNRLPIPHSMETLPIMHVWCNVYGCGVIASHNVAVWFAAMQCMVKWLETKKKNVATEVGKDSDLLHGQETSLREEGATEEARRKKGKSIAGEEVATKQTTPTQDHNRTVEELLQLSTWTTSIPDGFIKLDYEDRWKMFEDGLPKEECKLENHELWQPTFAANIINSLVRYLAKKIKVPNEPLVESILKAEAKALEITMIDCRSPSSRAFARRIDDHSLTLHQLFAAPRRRDEQVGQDELPKRGLALRKPLLKVGTLEEPRLSDICFPYTINGAVGMQS
eukprot:Gb_31551 [translate_table: standard]